MNLTSEKFGFGVTTYTTHKTEAEALKFIEDNKLEEMGDAIKVEPEGGMFVIVAYEADGYKIGKI